MNTMQSLLTLLAHAERERDAALGALRGCQIEQRKAQAQADQLTRYRLDYEERWRGEFSRGGQIAIVQCYQGFMARLGQAIEQQTQIARIAAQRMTQAEAVWRECELRVASVEKLIGRRNLALRDAESRREQKLQDDQATRIAWQRRADRVAAA